MIGTAVVALAALLFLAMGIYGLTAPAALVAAFGIALRSADGRAEVRAVYGGFGVAIAGVLALAAFDFGGLRQGMLIAVAAALLGMAGGRLVSRAVEGRQGFYPIWLYFWIELAGAAALLAVVALP